MASTRVMRGLCYKDVGVVELRSDLPIPRVARATDAVVRVTHAGVCGSDLHPLWGREPGLDPGTVMGHEFVGVVVEAGAGVRAMVPGTRCMTPFTTSCGACFYCTRGLSCRCEHPDARLFGWRSGGVGLHGGQAEYVLVPLADSTLRVLPDKGPCVCARVRPRVGSACTFVRGAAVLRLC